MNLLFKKLFCGALLSVGALQVNAMEEAVDAAADALHQALTEACRSNDETEVRALIALGAPVNAREQDPDVTSYDPLFEEPLHVACERGYFEIARVLVENGANVWIPKYRYVTPMYLACAQGSLPIAELLIAHADENALGDEPLTDVPDFNEVTPLHIASKKGHVDIMRLLIQEGVDLECLDGFGRTPFYLACKRNRLSAAELLLEHGVDVNVEAEEGFPLCFACDHRNLGMALLLLATGRVDVNKKKNDCENTCLHVASEAGSLDIVKLLISYKADVFAKNLEGQLPIDLATDPEVRKVLLGEALWRIRLPAVFLASEYATRNIVSVLPDDVSRFVTLYL